MSELKKGEDNRATSAYNHYMKGKALATKVIHVVAPNLADLKTDDAGEGHRHAFSRLRRAYSNIFKDLADATEESSGKSIKKLRLAPVSDYPPTNAAAKSSDALAGAFQEYMPCFTAQAMWSAWKHGLDDDERNKLKDIEVSVCIVGGTGEDNKDLYVDYKQAFKECFEGESGTCHNHPDQRASGTLENHDYTGFKTKSGQSDPIQYPPAPPSNAGTAGDDAAAAGDGAAGAGAAGDGAAGGGGVMRKKKLNMTKLLMWGIPITLTLLCLCVCLIYCCSRAVAPPAPQEGVDDYGYANAGGPPQQEQESPIAGLVGAGGLGGMYGAPVGYGPSAGISPQDLIGRGPRVGGMNKMENMQGFQYQSEEYTGNIGGPIAPILLRRT